MTPATAAVLVAGALLMLLAAAGCGQDDPPSTGPQLVAFGHSFVYGREPDPDLEPWPSRAGTALGLPVLNQGVGGAESVDVLEVVRRYTPDPSDTIIVECILNDALRHGRAGLDVWRQSVDAILRHLVPGVPAARVLLVLDPPPQGSEQTTTEGETFLRTLRRYADAGREVAAKHGVRTVDLRVGWDSERDISEDGLHPNDAGTQRIADVVVRALRRG